MDFMNLYDTLNKLKSNILDLMKVRSIDTVLKYGVISEKIRSQFSCENTLSIQ